MPRHAALSSLAAPIHTPTQQIYTALQKAYDHYNNHLFGGRLPPVLFVLQRKTHTMGYISYSRWQNATGDCVDELAVNPEYFLGYSLVEVLSTLVHEMAHAARKHLSKVPEGRRSYHDTEWARIMISIGLMPSDTGKPGGKRTGQKIGEYVLIDGGFYIASLKLLYSGFGLPWLDRRPHPNVGYQYTVYTRKGEPVDFKGRADRPLIAPLGMGAGEDYREPENLNEAFPDIIQAPLDSIMGMLSHPLRVSGTFLENQPIRVVSGQEEGGGGEPEIINEPYSHPVQPIAISPDVRNPFFIQPVTEIEPKKNTRVKYTCSCDNNVWGRPNLRITCDVCEQRFVVSESIMGGG